MAKREAEDALGGDAKRQAPAPPPKAQQLLVYRDGEPLPGLLDLFKQHGDDAYVEVIIPPEHFVRDNRKVKSRQLWGDQIYTPDSDLVAVLVHLGYLSYLHHHVPMMAAAEYRALLKLLPAQEKYPSKSRFIKSRTWCSNNDGCSFKVLKCWLTQRTTAQRVELESSVEDAPSMFPTVMPQGGDRHVTTRTTGSKHSKQSQEVSMQYNLCNEPWLKYTTAAVADKGLKPSQWTSSRLQEEVLFLETHTERFQMSLAGVVGDDKDGAKPGCQGGKSQVYTLVKCKTPLPLGLMRKVGVPMPADMVEVVETSAEWEEFKWSTNALHLRGKEYQLKRLQFMKIEKPKEGGAA